MKKFISCLALSFIFFSFFVRFPLAETEYPKVDNSHTIYIKGNKVNMPEDMTVINYKGRVYVPLRFVSELMGLGVDYTKNDKTISITESVNAKPLYKEEEYLEEIEKWKNLYSEEHKKVLISTGKIEELEKVANYNKIPITYSSDKYPLEMKLYFILLKDDLTNTTKFNFEIKNDSYLPVSLYLDQAKVSYTSDNGVDVELKSMSGTKYYKATQYDLNSHNVNSSFEPYSENKFYFSTELVPEDVKYATLTFDYSFVGESEKYTVSMPIEFR